MIKKISCHSCGSKNLFNVGIPAFAGMTGLKNTTYRKSKGLNQTYIK